MVKYKLVCSDLDDTLIGKSGEVTEKTKEAVRAYVERGGMFRIVTGRMTVGALPICRDLGLHGELASYQGAIISDVDTGEVYRKTVIPFATSNSSGIGNSAKMLQALTDESDAGVGASCV